VEKSTNAQLVRISTTCFVRRTKMPGTKPGGIKARDTNYERYGRGFYVRIGAIGGKKSTGGGFGSDKIGEDGLTGKERARLAGAVGGSKRKGRKFPKG
jgi:hypothetical protein